MLISEDQLEANRQNAQKSTGPSTDAGKAISSRNALKHGRYSDQIVIRGQHINENPEDYDRLLSAISDQLKPDNVFEESIVTKIANCIWRSRRVIIAETALIKERLADIDPQMRKMEAFSLELDKCARREPRPTPRRQWQRERRSRAAQYLVPDRRYVHDLQLYDMRLDRQLIRLYKLYYSIKQTSTADRSSAEHSSAGSSEVENRSACAFNSSAAGKPLDRRELESGTKTTETNPTSPEPQQVTPSTATDTDRPKSTWDPESARIDAILLSGSRFYNRDDDETNLDSGLRRNEA